MTDEQKQSLFDSMRESARKDLLSGLITLNEYWAEIGMPLLPPEQGNVFLLPEGQTRIHRDDLAKLLRMHAIVDDDVVEQFLKLAADKSD